MSFFDPSDPRIRALRLNIARAALAKPLLLQVHAASIGWRCRLTFPISILLEWAKHDVLSVAVQEGWIEETNVCAGRIDGLDGGMGAPHFLFTPEGVIALLDAHAAENASLTAGASIPPV